MNRGVALEATGVEVVVHFRLVAGAPEVHELVYLVNEGYGASARRFEAEVAALAAVPGFELYFGAAA